MKTIVAQRVLDDRGQSVAETKAVFLDGSGVLSYRADAVTALDPATLALSGAIADAAPADGGYPYQGKAYDSSPLGRVVARGIPGAEFAIVPGAHAPHDQEIEYGANAPTGPLPAGVFTAQTTTLPNPATGPIAAPVSQVTLSEPSLGTVAQIDAADAKSGSLSLTVYDELGNAVALHPPAYFDPPSGDPADWAHTFELTPLSDVAAWTAPDTGKLRCIYDLAGRLRFAQTPAGAAAGWFAYRRYDVLGRTVEVGTLNGDWDGAALQQRADTDPGWPAADTWQRRYGYDGDGSVPHALGRPTASWANQPGGAIVETYTYDACGGLADATLAVPGYDGATRAVSFEANAVGDIVRTAFSSTLGDFVPVPIVTTYDALGRVGEVALDGGATLARFTYNADGTPATETLDPDGAAPVTRTLAYLSPGWPATITDSDPKGLIFGQELTYTSGGYQGSGWFDGRIASASFRYGWQDAPEDLGWAYLYDASGALITAKSTLGGELDVGVTTPFVYDPNGNATAGSVGNDALSYEYAPGTNQATTLTGLGGARGYGYDAAGRVKSVTSPAGDVAFGYDGMRLAPATASWSGGTIAYAYGPRRTRAMRVAHDTTGAELARKLYVRDLHGRLLAERVLAGGAETVVQHVAGPFGDVALLVHAGGATTTYFPLRDVQGSTRVVLGPGNAVVAAYDYLPSGAVARSSGRLADFFTFLYTGQELEPELGLYDYRARFYDPALGRFLAPDPDAELFGTYTYAEDDPVLYTDPTGGFGFLAILGLVAQVLLDVAIEAASLGAATPAEAPLIIGEVATDTAAARRRRRRDRDERGARGDGRDACRRDGQDRDRGRGDRRPGRRRGRAGRARDGHDRREGRPYVRRHPSRLRVARHPRHRLRVRGVDREGGSDRERRRELWRVFAAWPRLVRRPRSQRGGILRPQRRAAQRRRVRRVRRPTSRHGDPAGGRGSRRDGGGDHAGVSAEPQMEEALRVRRQQWGDQGTGNVAPEQDQREGVPQGEADPEVVLDARCATVRADRQRAGLRSHARRARAAGREQVHQAVPMT